MLSHVMCLFITLIQASPSPIWHSQTDNAVLHQHDACTAITSRHSQAVPQLMVTKRMLLATDSEGSHVSLLAHVAES